MSEGAPVSAGTPQPPAGVAGGEGSAGGPERATSATSGDVSRASAGTSTTGVGSAPTTTISTIAVQSGNTKIVLALLQSGEWLELRVVELNPGLVYLGSSLEESMTLQQAHDEVLAKLQSKQSPVEDLLNQADQLISTQKPRAEVYAAMAESLGLAWRDLNAHLETRKKLLDMSVLFHTRARQYNDALDAAEKVYTDNVMPSDAEGVRQLLSTLQEHKRAILESSMYTLQEAQALLDKLRGFVVEGASMDSRPQQIRTNIEFACSQIEHYLEALHDRRRFLDGLYVTRKLHLEQCLTLCLLYQDLTAAVLNLKKLRDEMTEHQSLGDSQANAEILLHEHLRREAQAKEQQDICVRHVGTSEQMVSGGHYAGIEARARAYSVLEAATALHETCSTRTALLEQSALFFKLASAALTKLDQADVQVAGIGKEGGQRLSLVMGIVEEAVQPALTEGYAILEVTGGRGQPHNEGITNMVEQLENRRTKLSVECASSTEQAVQRTELINTFLEQYNSIDSWLVRIGDAFLQGHQDPGGSLSLAKDFLHLHMTLKGDMMDKSQEINALERFLIDAQGDLSPEDFQAYKDKIQGLKNHWDNLRDIIDARISLSEKYVRFHEGAEGLTEDFEALENLLKMPPTDPLNNEIEDKWKMIQEKFQALKNCGQDFITTAQEINDPYLDVKRAILCVKSILENLGKRKLSATDLHSHFQMKISITKELTLLWKTYRDNLTKMEKEMHNLENELCPLLRGDPSDPDGMANSLEQRISAYVGCIKKIQADIEDMVTKAEGYAHKDDIGCERPEVVKSLLQLYQNLQNKTTDYQILGAMLAQWCRNISEVHKSCDKLESQFGTVSKDLGGVEGQLREHEAGRQAVEEVLNFAKNEADAIIQKIRTQCPKEPGAKDIATMKEMLDRRKRVIDQVWSQRQTILERQLKRSQYQCDLQVISDQLRDLSDQLARMKGHYGDSLKAALKMKNAFIQFKQTVDMLEKRIQNFVSTAEKMMGAEDDSGDMKMELAELEKKWTVFYQQVGESQKNIDLSIEFFKLVEEAEDWFKEGSQLLVGVAGESSQIKSPEEAVKLRQRIESFLTPGEEKQAARIRSISSLAILLYGETTPQQVEAVAEQNQMMLDSFKVIHENLSSLVDNLKKAEVDRSLQEKEQEELAASLAAAKAEAEAARLAALAAEEARKAAEEMAKAQPPPPPEPIIEKKETIIEVKAIPLPPEVVMEEEIVVETKKAKFIDDEPQHLPPVFIAPLVGATVSEGVKFTFECRVTGFPPPQVEWFKDGLSIMSNPDYRTSYNEGVCGLTIEETFTEDSALFTCKAANASGLAETSASLTVKEATPTEVMAPPTFTKKLADLAIKEGSPIQLEATVEGHPLPVVTWSKNGLCIDDAPDYVITYNNGDCKLRFEEVFLEDQAEYCCKATNQLGEDVTTSRVTVISSELTEKPHFTIPLSNVMARAGQKFILEGHVAGSPLPTLSWFHNGKPIKETPDCKITCDGNLATLVVMEAFPKHAGTYSLVAKNSAGEAQVSSNVSVKGRIPTETSDSELTSDVDVEPVKPSIQLPLKDVEVVEGSTVRLDCVIVGQPEPEVIWYHDDKPVKESEDFKLLFHGDRCSLLIQEAFLEDAGDYRVVAMNSAGEASTSSHLSVKVPEPEPPPAIPPKFSKLLVDSHVVEGNPISLTTTVSGNPAPTIAWFRDGVPLLPDNQVQIMEEEDGSAIVTIPRATLDHTGQYEVVASNSAGTAKCVGFLSIEPRLPTPPPKEPEEPPTFKRLLEDVLVTSGDSATFEVEVTGKPTPSVHWTLNDSEITGMEYQKGALQYQLSEPGPNRYQLRVNETTPVQVGRVRAIAENPVGKATSSCMLNVIEPLPPVRPEPNGPLQESVDRRTFVSETRVTKVVTSSSSEEGPTKKSVTTSSTSFLSSATGQPTAEDQFAKLEDKSVVEEVAREQISTPPLQKKAPPRKSVPAKFVVPIQGVIAKEGDRVVLEGTFEGYPSPSVEWSRAGGPLPQEAVPAVHLNKVSLAIPEATPSLAGRYTCVLENEAGIAECTCDLVVRKTLFPPVFSKRLQPSVLGVGDRLHLEVDVSGTPAPTVEWTKNGSPVEGQDNTTVKEEGTRHWLVIPQVDASDSGRYGVCASNEAGRAECLADVLVTNLVRKDDPSTKIIFTEVSDSSRSFSQPLVEEGRVGTLKKAIEESSLDIPVETIKETQEEPQEAKRLPGKLKQSWPPLPTQEEDEDQAQKIDPSLEISKHTVSSIVSSFNAAVPEQVESPPAEFHAPRPVNLKVEKEPCFIEDTGLVPEPEPEYGFIENIPSPQEKLKGEVEVVPCSELEVPDTDLSDNYLSQTSDCYPRTSPSLEVEPVETSDIDKVEPKEMETTFEKFDPNFMKIKTEKHVKESSFTEVKKSFSTSERTFVETKVYRDFPESGIITSPTTPQPEVVFAERRSGDEEDGSLKKQKKKRESVRQIALRLEENIAPLTPDEVPGGGIRMFPTPKPQTPAIEPTKEPTPELLKMEDKPLFESFPQLEPFPFKVEEKPHPERTKLPPPPKPKKFIPGSFTDTEYDSDMDIGLQKYSHKKIHFEVAHKSQDRSVSDSEIIPPSRFDKPPVFEAMRPDILKGGKIQAEEPKEEAHPPPKKEFRPKKKPRIVEKFLAASSATAEENVFVAEPSIAKRKATSPPPVESKMEPPCAKAVKLQEQAVPVQQPVPIKKVQAPCPPQQEEKPLPPTEEKFETSTRTVEESFEKKEFSTSSRTEILQKTTMQSGGEFVPPPLVAPIAEPVKQKPVALPPHPVIEAAQTKTQFMASSESIGFRPVKAPTMPAKVTHPAPSTQVAPPFDIAPIVLPPVEKPAPIPKEPIIPKEPPVPAMKKEKIVFKEVDTNVQTKLFAAGKKKRDSWPPKTGSQPEESPSWLKGRSHSMERPRVTEAPSLPTISQEAPPTVYWSGNVILSERTSWPTLVPDDRHVTAMRKDETVVSETKKETHMQVQKQESKPVDVFKTPVVPKPTIRPRPVSVHAPPSEPVPDALPPCPPMSTSLDNLDRFGFKPIPQGEPFPFTIPAQHAAPRTKGPPPSRPKKFVPGSFTESDYESDYEGRPPSMWRPSMSDSEAMEYKPIQVELRGGRPRSRKVKSPSPPSKFETPPAAQGVFRPTVSLSDLEYDLTHAEVAPPPQKLPEPPVPAQSVPKKPFKPTIKPVAAPPLRQVPTMKPKEKTSKPFGSAETIVKKGVSLVRSRFESSKTESAQPSPPLVPWKSAATAPSPVKSVGFTPKPQPTAPLRMQGQVISPSLIQSAESLPAPSKEVATTTQFAPPAGGSPKEKKKIESVGRVVKRTKEIEESGYAADTESTLPRRSAKMQTGFSSFSKAESFSSSSSYKFESKSSHSQQSSFESFGQTQTGFPHTGPAFGATAFPSGTPAGGTSKSFSTSESKSSQMYSSRKEHTSETRSEEETHDDGSIPKATRKPKFEEYRRETRGEPGKYGPFSEDTFYSMSDESEVITDKGKKKKKVEMKSESHVEIMSDKKSETYRYSTQGTPRKTEIPKEIFKEKVETPTWKVEEKRIPVTEPSRERKVETIKSEVYIQQEPPRLTKEPKKPTEPKVIMIELEPKFSREHPVKTEPTQPRTTTEVEPQKRQPIREDFAFKSERIEVVKPVHSPYEVLSHAQGKSFDDLDLKPFPYKPEPERSKRSRGPPPPSPKKFVRGEFTESDYGSDYEGRIPQTWRPTDSDTDDHIYSRVAPPRDTPKDRRKVRSPTPPSKFDVPPKMEGILRPKIEFPESEPEVDMQFYSDVEIVERPEKQPPKIAPKEPQVVKSQPPKKTAVKPQPPPPVTETKHEEIPSTQLPYSNAVGVESTKITKIEDSSQFHRRFVTMQQTTRVVKLSDSAETKTHTFQKEQGTVPESPIKAQEKPLPKLEPFPFTVKKEAPKRETGPPPPQPKKFHKEEFKESDYESDFDEPIKAKWRPLHSDAEEPTYTEVRPPPSFLKTLSKPKSRSPTPPTEFDRPPPTGEPLRPVFEPVQKIAYKEPSEPQILVPPITEQYEHVRTVPETYREHSPVLRPGTPPEEGIITKKVEYVADTVDVKTKRTPPEMKPVQTYKEKPYREIIERKEIKITDKKFKEEKRIRKDKVETIKTTVTKYIPDEQPTPTSDLQRFANLEPFPFQPDTPKPKRDRGVPPSQPSRFVKGEFRESDYGSDYEERIAPKWRPAESETDEPEFGRVEVHLTSDRRDSGFKPREPTPPSEIQMMPPPSGPMRPEIQLPEPHIPVYRTPPQQESAIREDIAEASLRDTTYKSRFEIDVDVTDVYEIPSEPEQEPEASRTPVKIDFQPYKELEPFPFTAEPDRPKRERAAPPPTPKKFLKGEFRESDYESDFEGRILPKWRPTDSEEEIPAHRRVQAPSLDRRPKQAAFETKAPSPPSKFDEPPQFEGPPRPVVDISDIPRRERRESLEEYSIPKFPKVEFKPFDMEIAEPAKPKKVLTDGVTEEEILKKTTFTKTADKKISKTTQKYVGEQFGDMNQTFRDKAQRFAEQLVSEVFAGREEDREELPSAKEVPASKKPITNGTSDEPQSYREESRASEFGSKHIDPDTGLIYFKYDFGYEFGILFPGEGKPVDKKSTSMKTDQNGSIEIPVLHFKSDDESKLHDEKVSLKKKDLKTKTSPKVKPFEKSFTRDTREAAGHQEYSQYLGKIIPEFVPKKQAQFKPIVEASDSEIDYNNLRNGSRKQIQPRMTGSKFGFAPVAKQSLHHQQSMMSRSAGGSNIELTSPGLVSSFCSLQTSKSPIFTVPLRNMAVQEGDELFLECTVQGVPPMKVFWRKNGKPLEEGPRCQTVFKNGVCTVHIPRVGPDDCGLYICTVSNGYGIGSSTACVSTSGERS